VFFNTVESVHGIFPADLSNGIAAQKFECFSVKRLEHSTLQLLAGKLE